MNLWSTDRDLEPPCDDEHGGGQRRDKGLNLDMHLPPSLAASLNAFASHQDRLYDGRMTKGKLQQVGRVTRDAIEVLHRYALCELMCINVHQCASMLWSFVSSTDSSLY